MRTFEYRLYPTKNQQYRLQQCLIETRQAYNAMLEHAKQQYEHQQTFPNKYDLDQAFAGTAGEYTPATTLQTVSDRLAKALKFFLNHRTERQADGSPRVGFPRFKLPNQWHSFQLRQYGHGNDVRVDGRHLVVPKKFGPRIKIKLHRPVEGTPKTVYVVKRADHHWYALIVCELPDVSTSPTPDDRPAVGIDVGLKSFLTDSDGNLKPRAFFVRRSGPCGANNEPGVVVQRAAIAARRRLAGWRKRI
jgi:putative transposase